FGAVMLCCALAPAQSNPAPSALDKSSGAKARVAVPPEKAKPIHIPRLDKPPVIDGKLDDEVWKQAAVLKDFYQINPVGSVAASGATEAYMGYASRFLS